MLISGGKVTDVEKDPKFVTLDRKLFTKLVELKALRIYCPFTFIDTT